MSKLWNWVDSKSLSEEGKISFFLFLNCLKYSLLGFVVWLLVSRFAFCTWEFAFCFAGYSGLFIGYVGGFIFVCRK